MSFGAETLRPLWASVGAVEMVNLIPTKDSGLVTLLARSEPLLEKAGFGGATETLVSAGAQRAASPREAANEAKVVLVTVTDDAASREVWLDPERGVLAGLNPTAVGVESSTISPRWARELAGAVAAAGRRFVEAPMIGSLPQVETQALQLLVAGEAAAVSEARGPLEQSTSKIFELGAFGEPATIKLIVNAFLAVQVAALGELLRTAAATGLDVEATSSILTSLPVASPAATRAAARIVAADFEPNFPVRLVAKDLGYLVPTASAVGERTPVARAVRDEYHQLVRTGHGDLDLVAIGSAPTPLAPSVDTGPEDDRGGRQTRG